MRIIPILYLTTSALVIAIAESAFEDASSHLSALVRYEVLDFVLNRTKESAFSGYGFDSIDSHAAVSELVDEISAFPEQSQGGFPFLLNRMLLGLFQDAHFRVEVSTESHTKNQYLDICLNWLPANDRYAAWDLIVTDDADALLRGQKVMSIGNMTSDDFFQSLKATIPHENEYFIAGLDSSWLIRDDYLAFFEMLNADGTVSITVEGEAAKRDIPLVGHPCEPPHLPESFVSYHIFPDDSTALFRLDECIYNDEFATVLVTFWENVVAKHIDTVVLDLRQNRGGDFTVGPAFLQYITSDPYSLFEVDQRQSVAFCEQIPASCDPGTLSILESAGVNTTNEVYTIPGQILSAFYASIFPPDTDKVVDVDLFVLISEITFSSGHLLAGVIQQNGLGTLVGGPTGNTPTFWGNVLQFPIPKTDLTLFLTTSKTSLFVDEGDAVMPDYFVPTTPDDVRARRDAQIEWVLNQRRSQESTDSTGLTSIDSDNGSASLAVPLMTHHWYDAASFCMSLLALIGLL